MKFAVNYSDILMELLAENPELPVDYIKVPTIPFPGCWLQFDRGETKRAILPHLAQPGVIALGRTAPEEQFNPELVDQVLQRTHPPHLSTHVEARVDCFPEYREYHHQAHPVIRQVLREHFLQAIATVKAHIGIPLVLENFPYYSWWRHYKTGSEPEFVSEICAAGDCGFLLDIAHARCSAWHYEMDLKTYLSGLPLHRLREIHLAGTQLRLLEGLRDTHGRIDETDYATLEYLLQHSAPQIVTLEYGGMPERLLNFNGEFEPISRNNKTELQEMIAKITALIGTRPDF